MSFRVGMGYDIHRLVEGRKLFLGGIEVPYLLGLEGHSDADVVIHAICDALLGASGQGDIGEHFPNTDPQYKDISSSKLLAHVKELIEKEGYLIENIDVVILTEEPSLKDFKNPMKEHLAGILSLEAGQIGIKAATNEKLGAIGRQEGIATLATALLSKS